MGLFNKRHDPISERERALQSEIAALDARIKSLDDTSRPDPNARPRAAANLARPAQAPSGEPIFERIDQHDLRNTAQQQPAPHQFNELGLRKYDLTGVLARWRKHLFGASVSNPRLVSFLAAGSVQGLRSLRFEKRVARRRFIFWALLFFLIGFGILAASMRRHS